MVGSMFRIRCIPCSSLRSIPSLPRVGMSLGLDPSLFNVTYFGRGPHENYPDRKSSAEMGIWSTTAKENHFDYIVPSENGSKSDCEWVAFRDEQGSGVCVVSEQTGMNFNASLYSQEELELAKHTYDLPVRENGKSAVHVNIDSSIMGGEFHSCFSTKNLCHCCELQMSCQCLSLTDFLRPFHTQSEETQGT